MGFQHAIGQGGVAEDKAVAIAGDGEGNVQQRRVIDGLRHAGTDRMAVVFGLDHNQRDVGLVKQHVIGTEHGLFVAGGMVATHHHPARPQGVLAVNLLDRVPARLLDGRRDELFADIRF